MKRLAIVYTIAASFLFSVFFTPLVPRAYGAEVLERIIAVVNDEIVTEQDLMFAMGPVISQFRTVYTGAELQEKLKEARADFLNKVIEDKLILSEAKRRQVIVKDSEVDDMISDVRNKFPSKELFLKAIEDQGMTEKKIWNRFKDQLMTQKLVSYEVKSRVSVSPGEVSEYYKTHPEDFVQNDRVNLMQILIRTTTRSEEEAKALADSLVERLKAGASFEELASTNSEGAEAADGGKMGWLEKGQLVGDIDDKVFVLQEGQITDPIKSTLGYHIFKVVKKESYSVKPISEVREMIQEKLQKQKIKIRLEAWVKELKKNAYISVR